MKIILDSLLGETKKVKRGKLTISKMKIIETKLKAMTKTVKNLKFSFLKMKIFKRLIRKFRQKNCQTLEFISLRN